MIFYFSDLTFYKLSYAFQGCFVVQPLILQVSGELVWSKKTQGYVLSAFFWGYMCSQVIGGYLAGRYGGKLVIGITVFAGSILTFLSPAAAKTSAYAFIALRALLGLFQVILRRRNCSFHFL